MQVHVFYVNSNYRSQTVAISSQLTHGISTGGVKDVVISTDTPDRADSVIPLQTSTISLKDAGGKPVMSVTGRLQSGDSIPVYISGLNHGVGSGGVGGGCSGDVLAAAGGVEGEGWLGGTRVFVHWLDCLIR